MDLGLYTRELKVDCESFFMIPIRAIPTEAAAGAGRPQLGGRPQSVGRLQGDQGQPRVWAKSMIGHTGGCVLQAAASREFQHEPGGFPRTALVGESQLCAAESAIFPAPLYQPAPARPAPALRTVSLVGALQYPTTPPAPQFVAQRSPLDLVATLPVSQGLSKIRRFVA